MDIEGLGVRQVVVLLEQGLIKDAADLYALEGRQEELVAIDRMGKKSVENLLVAIEASKDRPLARVLTALGIDHVGIEVAEALSRHFRTIDAIMDATEEALSQVPSIGPKIAASVSAYFANESNKAVVQKLQCAGVSMADEDWPEPGEQSPGRAALRGHGTPGELQPLPGPGQDQGRGRRGQRQRQQAPPTTSSPARTPVPS